MLKFICKKPFTDGGQTFKMLQEITIDKTHEHYEYFNMMAQKGNFSVMEVKIVKQTEDKQIKAN
jgi:hypothetical protein